MATRDSSWHGNASGRYNGVQRSKSYSVIGPPNIQRSLQEAGNRVDYHMKQLEKTFKTLPIFDEIRKSKKDLSRSSRSSLVSSRTRNLDFQKYLEQSSMADPLGWLILKKESQGLTNKLRHALLERQFPELTALYRKALNGAPPPIEQPSSYPLQFWDEELENEYRKIRHELRMNRELAFRIQQTNTVDHENSNEIPLSATKKAVLSSNEEAAASISRAASGSMETGRKCENWTSLALSKLLLDPNGSKLASIRFREARKAKLHQQMSILEESKVPRITIMNSNQNVNISNSNMANQNSNSQSHSGVSSPQLTVEKKDPTNELSPKSKLLTAPSTPQGQKRRPASMPSSPGGTAVSINQRFQNLQQSQSKNVLELSSYGGNLNESGASGGVHNSLEIGQGLILNASSVSPTHNVNLSIPMSLTPNGKKTIHFMSNTSPCEGGGGGGGSTAAIKVSPSAHHHNIHRNSASTATPYPLNINGFLSNSNNAHSAHGNDFASNLSSTKRKKDSWSPANMSQSGNNNSPSNSVRQVTSKISSPVISQLAVSGGNIFDSSPLQQSKSFTANLNLNSSGGGGGQLSNAYHPQPKSPSLRHSLELSSNRPFSSPMNYKTFSPPDKQLASKSEGLQKPSLKYHPPRSDIKIGTVFRETNTRAVSAGNKSSSQGNIQSIHVPVLDTIGDELPPPIENFVVNLVNISHGNRHDLQSAINEISREDERSVAVELGSRIERSFGVSRVDASHLRGYWLTLKAQRGRDLIKEVQEGFHRRMSLASSSKRIQKDAKRFMTVS